MVFLNRQYMRLALFHAAASNIRRPRTGVTVDWQYAQTVYRLALFGRMLMLVVDHKAPVHRFFSSIYEDAQYAEMEHYWEFGGAGGVWTSERSRRWDLRRVFWQTYARSLFAHLYYPLVCRVRGHRCESWADPENGFEQISCTRCGWQISHYF